ncbi:MAG TPA: hypothetical protein VFX28_00540 [Methylomirabilota bacterium]|nr:hypothetical protein [Methylomirabilota bacterium]
MYLSPEAQRLLEDVRRAHEQLLAHFGAGDAHRRAFRAVYAALESALGDIDDKHLVTPVEGGWSPAEVLVHVAEHDHMIEEATRRGIEHMIEHGLEHARGLWQARMRVAEPAAAETSPPA